ncbi:MAG TPA: peptide chain release factor N(5)-glutamine methyltransferase [Sphingorhabdus sp.]|jgi:release factor glutamine methyltransferase|uniref:peptide chain release factor N(5)-glutamine methyltransferase n=1 Tax=Sphingorhabdus sp. TaxID=1902408 RepID=UPI002C6C5886|nr:peptide chain release factor N(5)-glutamine methyltransferase [Sphingorhabdus sp.]HMT40977.1 peptide chain release factor N(5)-glutamine methyltransferase [Sphingorhabdus sp.]HMU22366.1 peptide chain release factor N(5)-glutamine methyltransferase [Sphingorhabdus sp.]
MSISASQQLVAATQLLERVSDTPRLDAELLMAHALGLSRNNLLLRARDLTPPAEFDALLQRRLAHEPVAYIRGYQEFWDLTLVVTPDVLIPRGDSETLIEAAQRHFAGSRPPHRILDLGTGSGALILAGLSIFKEAQGVAIDASAEALAVAQNNAERLGFGDRGRFYRRSWRDAGWADDLGRFDLILCNPPYVETEAELAPQVRAHEPASALFAGADGLDDYKLLIPQISALLTSGGVAIFEIGQGQDAAVTKLAKEQGFAIQPHRDLAGIIRALSLSKPGSG